MTQHQTSCPLDCPDGCSMEVDVEGDRVTSIRGTKVNPLTAGFICSKVRNFHKRLRSDERITEPGIRVGPKGSGEFRKASWDEALSHIVNEIKRVRDGSGAQAILPLSYGGSNGKLTEGGFDRRFFQRLGASKLDRKVCAAPTKAAFDGLYGGMPGIALDDYEHAKLIVVWGTNPSATGIHFVPIVKRAQAAGAKLIVIDTRRTPLAKRADLHLAPRPGTDLPLALAMIGWLFQNDKADLEFLEKHATGFRELEAKAAVWTLDKAAAECGVAASDIETFAQLYADTKPTALRCGYGFERNRNGGSAAAAVLALPAVAGHFGARASGFTLATSTIWNLDIEAAADVPDSDAPIINQNHVGRALNSNGVKSPIEMVFVYNHNPIATLPHQMLVRRGFEREDLFTVVHEQVMTDTALYADVILPATTFLEHEDLRAAYGSYSMLRITPVVSPVGESRDNASVFGELSRRLGLEKETDATTPRELEERFLKGTNFGEVLDSGRAVLPDEGDHPVQFGDIFPRTSDGKIQLHSDQLNAESKRGLYVYIEDPATDEYPLALISPSLAGTITSTCGELITEPVPLEMNPVDAAARGLNSGQTVRVHNNYGEVICPLKLTDDIAPGTVALPKGMWRHSSMNGNTSNALSPDTLSDLGAGACFNDARVQVD
ncbi:MAG: anaerobic selenocysteine-containing dehydrogenase [Planctomycetota bacterium]|jgi:anaerobic selenocysteine-containing dehydrogenase